MLDFLLRFGSPARAETERHTGDSVLLQRGLSARIEEKGILTGYCPTRARFLRPLWRLAGSLLLTLLVASSTPTLAASLKQPVVFCSLPVDKAPSDGRADGMLPSDYGEGASLMVLQPDGATRRLTSDFASACDPDVSFDGERILFAAQRQAGDPWNIWEMRSDGTAPRQITHETLDARRPIYLSTFYTITSSEPWYTLLFERQDGVLNEAGTAPGTSLYTVRLDGSELRRITFHPGNDHRRRSESQSGKRIDEPLWACDANVIEPLVRHTHPNQRLDRLLGNFGVGAACCHHSRMKRGFRVLGGKWLSR